MLYTLVDIFSKRNLLLFLIVVFSSGASIISSNEAFTVIAFLYTTYIYYRKRKFVIDPLHVRIVFIFLLICAFYYILNGGIDINTWFGLLLRIFVPYNVIRIFGSSFSFHWIRMIRILCIISLVGFVLQILAPGFLASVNNLFSDSAKANSNSLLFNYTPLHPFRNCGPMWEPGAFAALLSITLLLSQVYTGKVLSKYNLPIILAILTTISTTGYLCLLVLFFVQYRQQENVNPIFYVMFFAAFLLVSTLDFVYVKIFKQYQDLGTEVELATNAPSQYQVSISRFASFAVDYQTFVKRPLFGFGADVLTTSKGVYFSQFGENINRSSGLMGQLVRFGILGLLAFFVLLYKSLVSVSDSNLSIWGILILLFLLFSNPISFSMLVFMLFFLKFTLGNDTYWKKIEGSRAL